jgi:hypothetical protein
MWFCEMCYQDGSPESIDAFIEFLTSDEISGVLNVLFHLVCRTTREVGGLAVWFINLPINGQEYQLLNQ